MKRQKTNYIVIHCSATPPQKNVTAALIDSWHRARGWNGIGYHFLIRRDGLIENGRHPDEAGAHVKNFNMQSVGVCLAGGVNNEGRSEDNFTSEQWESLCHLVQTLTLMYPNAEVLGHRDLSPDLDGDGIILKHEWMKDCPCFEVRAWWENVA